MKIGMESLSIETPIACKKHGWKWNNEYGVCIQFEDKTGGCLAPVKGLELCWEGIDLYHEVHADDFYKGKYLMDLVGMNFEGEHIVNSGEWGHDSIYDSMKEAFDDGKYIACDMAKDIMKGRAHDWCLHYKSPSGRLSKRPTPHCTVTDVGHECSIFYKDAHKKPFRFKQRRGYYRES